jgi:hypothetical protein
VNAPDVKVSIVRLVPHVALPRPASAHTRAPVPSGYGVQEQCLPFTAASALGFLVPSPIRFGWCDLAEVPPGGHAFRSPLTRADANGRYADSRVVYVVDAADCRFHSNAFEWEGMAVNSGSALPIREPGISFFDREDQQDLFKVHLPYVWRTPEAVDTLIGPLINRSAHGLEVQSGLVETDWYASPVNLVLRRPPGPVHVQAGEPLAQAFLIPRHFRRPTLDVAADHSRLSRETHKGLAIWDQQHAADPNAYKLLARSKHGRIEAEPAASSAAPPPSEERSE